MVALCCLGRWSWTLDPSLVDFKLWNFEVHLNVIGALPYFEGTLTYMWWSSCKKILHKIVRGFYVVYLCEGHISSIFFFAFGPQQKSILLQFHLFLPPLSHATCPTHGHGGHGHGLVIFKNISQSKCSI